MYPKQPHACHPQEPHCHLSPPEGEGGEPAKDRGEPRLTQPDEQQGQAHPRPHQSLAVESARSAYSHE